MSDGNVNQIGRHSAAARAAPTADAAVNNAPLIEAETHLNIAASSLDVLHDVFAIGDGALKESVAAGMAGMLFGILEHVRTAETLLAARFKHDGQ